MIYSTSITTANSKSKASATRTKLKITKGLIWLLEVDFPPGCVGLVHVQIFDGSYQILPASPDKTLSGDGRLLRYDDLYLKSAAPFELTIVTWNEDELWDHNIQIRIGLASTRLFMARYLPTIGWEDFAAQMGEVQKDQAKGKAEQVIELVKLTGGG